MHGRPWRTISTMVPCRSPISWRRCTCSGQPTNCSISAVRPGGRQSSGMDKSYTGSGSAAGSRMKLRLVLRYSLNHIGEIAASQGHFLAAGRKIDRKRRRLGAPSASRRPADVRPDPPRPSDHQRTVAIRCHPAPILPGALVVFFPGVLAVNSRNMNRSFTWKRPSWAGSRAVIPARRPARPRSPKNSKEFSPQQVRTD